MTAQAHTPVPRHCPECGFDTYKADNFDRLRDGNERLRHEIERQAARHAVEVAKLKLALMDAQDQKSGLQSKVARQRSVLNRLEARLRKQGVKPHGAEQ